MQQTGQTIRQPAEPFRLVADPDCRTKEDLALSSTWRYSLDEQAIADLDRAVAAVEMQRLPLVDVRRNAFELPILGKTLHAIREQIIDGRGFVLLRGVPVHRYTRLQSAIAFWGIGTYIGEAVSQNAEGHLLGHVKYLGDTSLNNPGHRGYQTPNTLPFHSNSTDVVGLLCLHASKSGGESTIASSVTIHNETLKRAPELVAALNESIYRDRRGSRQRRNRTIGFPSSTRSRAI